MPFTSAEIAEAGKLVLDHYLRNKPIDQIAVERPFLAALMKNPKEVVGAKQYIVDQLRYKYDSNFQWFNGAQVVTYNRRHVNEQTNWAWRSAHDGLELDEDRLTQHGITVVDEGPGRQASNEEMTMLANLLEEQSDSLRQGFEQNLSKECHRDGTQSTDAIAGLDAIVQISSTWGTTGGIDASLAANTWWRNHQATGLTTTTSTGTILTKMEIAWRACVRNGGRPNLILVGDDFYDGFRDFMMTSYGRIDFDAVSERTIEGGTKALTFHGVPLTWAPEFDDFDSAGLYGSNATFSKRCYMLNMNHLKLRPMKGHNMVTRKPPRPYDRYAHYLAIVWRGAMTCDRRNAHAVVSIS